jgi:hypothetical protein
MPSLTQIADPDKIYLAERRGDHVCAAAHRALGNFLRQGTMDAQRRNGGVKGVDDGLLAYLPAV